MPRCKCCKEKFTPKKFLQKYCMEKDECIKAFIAAYKDKKWKVEKKELKEKLKTHKDYLKILQVVFNTFIRTRDISKNEPCISCGCTMIGKKGDASHYFSVGSSPNLRFNEDNVHHACVYCNQHNHGNIAEYSIRLPLRIGQQRFEKLQAERNKPFKPSIPEIKNLIQEYKLKTKLLLNERS